MTRHAAILFDMDGTILTSIPAVERAWTGWAARVGVPATEVLDHLHGRRAIDTVRRFAPAGADIATEAAWVDAAELADTDGVAPIDGAAELLSALGDGQWAVVTSAIRALALVRIEAAGLPLPKVLIAAEDVQHGKPDPEGFLLGAARLGVDIADCLVFEDTDAGLQAGRRAGAQVIRVAGPHHSQQEQDTPAIRSYRDLDINVDADGIAVRHRQASGAV